MRGQPPAPATLIARADEVIEVVRDRDMLQNLRWHAQGQTRLTTWRWMSLSWLAVVIGGVYILVGKT